MKVIISSQNVSPLPGIEPGPPGWKPEILATRPQGIVYSYLSATWLAVCSWFPQLEWRIHVYSPFNLSKRKVRIPLGTWNTTEQQLRPLKGRILRKSYKWTKFCKKRIANYIFCQRKMEYADEKDLHLVQEGACPGVEPGTSCTRSKNHTTRPTGRTLVVYNKHKTR